MLLLLKIDQSCNIDGATHWIYLQWIWLGGLWLQMLPSPRSVCALILNTVSLGLRWQGLLRTPHGLRLLLDRGWCASILFLVKKTVVDLSWVHVFILLLNQYSAGWLLASNLCWLRHFMRLFSLDLLCDYAFVIWLVFERFVDYIRTLIWEGINAFLVIAYPGQGFLFSNTITNFWFFVCFDAFFEGDSFVLWHLW